MTTQLPNSLLTLSEALRSGQLSLMRFIDQLETRFEQREPSVLAFIPEPGRFARLRQEAQANYTLAEERRAEYKETEYLSAERVILTYEFMPEKLQATSHCIAYHRRTKMTDMHLFSDVRP